jgi:adenylate cyclase
VEGLIERLRAELPIWRVSTGIRTRHPEVSIVSFWWTEEEGMQVEDVAHAVEQASLDEGPVQQLYETGVSSLRWCLETPTGIPLLDRLRNQGATDYLLLRLPGLEKMGISFATRVPGGFTEAHVARLEGLRIPWSIRWDLARERHSTLSLLRSYLGHQAAKHVLHGAYRRTHDQRIRAIVFTCDLRGFTARVDAGPLEAVLSDLDRYFECVSEPWMDAGGEILKFVGDAVLGILPLGESPEDAAKGALDASREAFARLRAASAELPAGRSLEMGWVLHAGEVAYGNIGSRSRVDFTVIGPVVNEASRLESLTKSVAPLLISRAVASWLDPDVLKDVGTHPLRGVSHPVQLYTCTLD